MSAVRSPDACFAVWPPAGIPTAGWMAGAVPFAAVSPSRPFSFPTADRRDAGSSDPRPTSGRGEGRKQWERMCRRPRSRLHHLRDHPGRGPHALTENAVSSELGVRVLQWARRDFRSPSDPSPATRIAKDSAGNCLKDGSILRALDLLRMSRKTSTPGALKPRISAGRVKLPPPPPSTTPPAPAHGHCSMFSVGKVWAMRCHAIAK